jgi:hypothetical protein
MSNVTKEIIYFQETPTISFIHDLVTFSFCALLFAFNHWMMDDSKVEGFFFFIVFLIFAMGKANPRMKRFSNKGQLLKYLQQDESETDYPGT